MCDGGYGERKQSVRMRVIKYALQWFGLREGLHFKELINF